MGGVAEAAWSYGCYASPEIHNGMDVSCARTTRARRHSLYDRSYGVLRLTADLHDEWLCTDR